MRLDVRVELCVRTCAGTGLVSSSECLINQCRSSLGGGCHPDGLVYLVCVCVWLCKNGVHMSYPISGAVAEEYDILKSPVILEVNTYARTRTHTLILMTHRLYCVRCHPAPTQPISLTDVSERAVGLNLVCRSRVTSKTGSGSRGPD